MKSNKELLVEVETEALNIIVARDALIAAQSAALALAEGALEGVIKEADRKTVGFDRARQALAAIDKLRGTGEKG